MTPATPRERTDGAGTGAGVVGVVAAFGPSRHRFASWARREPVLAGLSWPSLKATLLDRNVDPDRKDDLLAGLVRLAQAGDPDAAMALAACLWPGLCNEARGLFGVLGLDEAWAEILAGLCVRVGSYDLAARPRRIASNLIKDAVRPLRRANKAHRQRRAVTCELPDSYEPPVHPEDITPTTILALAVDAGVIAPLDAVLIAATRLAEMQLKDAAALLGVDYEVAKKRRQRAEPALAAWWLPHNNDNSVSDRTRPAALAPVIALRRPRRPGQVA